MFAEGQFWHDQRTFTMNHLKDMGFGRTNIENQMLDEVQDFLGEIRRRAESNPRGIVEFSSLFNVSVVNILWAMVAGERFKRDDARFQSLLSNIQSLFRVGNQLRAATPIPLYLMRFLPFLKQFIGLRDELFVPMQQFVMVSARCNLRRSAFVNRSFIIGKHRGAYRKSFCWSTPRFYRRLPRRNGLAKRTGRLFIFK